MSFRPLLLGVVLLAACDSKEPSLTYRNPALRDELLTRVMRDQAVRDTFAAQLRLTGTLTPDLVAAMRAVDSVNLLWLEPQIRDSGFPSREDVGADGVKAAALLVQHADADPAFQAAVLPLLVAAFHAGDVTGQEVAMLTDRVAKAQGQPQVYGTQAGTRDGSVVFYPIEDSAAVDQRRQEMGLPPLLTYRAMLDSMYAQRPMP